MPSAPSVQAARDIATDDHERRPHPFRATLHALERLALHLGSALHPEGESEVIQFIRTNGGVLTDDLEREISRRFGNIVD